MTVGSLFSGIGGIELGLESLGLGPVRWQAESNPQAQAVLRTHWPEVPHLFDDVRTIDENAPRVDIICGGFPCQDISNAGKRAGINGERSGLWREFARIVRALRPRIVFVENVAALLGRGLDRVLGDLAALGFNAEWEVFRASDVGAPHRRERLFVLAYAVGGELRDESEPIGRGGGTAVPGDDGALLAHTNGWRREPVGLSGLFDGERKAPGDDANGRDGQGGGSAAADANGARWRPGARHADRGVGGKALCLGPEESGGRRGNVANPDGVGAGRSPEGVRSRESQPRGLGGARAHRFPPGPAGLAGWDGPQPAIRRGDDGVPGRSHRLRLLGNAVVPQQAALAFSALSVRAGFSEGRAWGRGRL